MFRTFRTFQTFGTQTLFRANRERLRLMLIGLSASYNAPKLGGSFETGSDSAASQPPGGPREPTQVCAFVIHQYNMLVVESSIKPFQVPSCRMGVLTGTQGKNKGNTTTAHAVQPDG